MHYVSHCAVRLRDRGPASATGIGKGARHRATCQTTASLFLPSICSVSLESCGAAFPAHRDEPTRVVLQTPQIITGSLERKSFKPTLAIKLIAQYHLGQCVRLAKYEGWHQSYFTEAQIVTKASIALKSKSCFIFCFQDIRVCCKKKKQTPQWSLIFIPYKSLGMLCCERESINGFIFRPTRQLCKPLLPPGLSMNHPFKYLSTIYR